MKVDTIFWDETDLKRHKLKRVHTAYSRINISDQGEAWWNRAH